MEFLYWHWLLLGIGLLIVELLIPSFTVFWFGLGALIVGLLLLVFPGMLLPVQIFIWALASCIFAFLWFKYLKPKMVDKTKAGISREAAIGESGQVIKVPVINQPGLTEADGTNSDQARGRVRFTTPILGDDEWEFLCEQQVALGDKVFIKEISGNTLIVVKLD